MPTYWSYAWDGTGSSFTNCTFTNSSTVTTTQPIRQWYASTSAVTTGQFYICDDNQWIPLGNGKVEMAHGPGSMNHRLWKQWNTDYVKDKDEARRQAELEDERRRIAAHAQVLARCVAIAQASGNRLEAFAVARLAEYNDDEWRTVEDAHQRAYEVRVEADRAAARVLVEHAEAQRKAEVLLVSILTAEQKREWLQYRRVTHVSPSGRTWRLFPQWAGGVTLMDDTGEVRRATLCVHTAARIPEADNMVGLLLSLRSGDEEHLISIANLSAGELTEDELRIRRERREGRGARPVNAGQVIRGAQARAIILDDAQAV